MQEGQSASQQGPSEKNAISHRIRGRRSRRPQHCIGEPVALQPIAWIQAAATSAAWKAGGDCQARGSQHGAVRRANATAERAVVLSRRWHMEHEQRLRSNAKHSSSATVGKLSRRVLQILAEVAGCTILPKPARKISRCFAFVVQTCVALCAMRACRAPRSSALCFVVLSPVGFLNSPCSNP